MPCEEKMSGRIIISHELLYRPDGIIISLDDITIRSDDK